MYYSLPEDINNLSRGFQVAKSLHLTRTLNIFDTPALRRGLRGKGEHKLISRWDESHPGK